MSGRVQQNQKEELKKAGLWDAFLKRRDELKDEEGLSPDQATETALTEFISQCKSSDSDDLPLAPKELADKNAKETEVIRWVFNSIDDPNPDPANCPSPGAWTLLRHCRQNAAFRYMFIEKIWTKLIPSRAQFEDDSDGSNRLDGQPTIDLINRIRAIRDRANAEEIEKNKNVK